MGGADVVSARNLYTVAWWARVLSNGSCFPRAEMRIQQRSVRGERKGLCTLSRLRYEPPI